MYKFLRESTCENKLRNYITSILRAFKKMDCEQLRLVCFAILAFYIFSWVPRISDWSPATRCVASPMVYKDTSGN